MTTTKLCTALLGGLVAAALSLTVQGQAFTTDVPLSGNGIGPKITVSPSPLKLGTSTVGVPRLSSTWRAVIPAMRSSMAGP